MKAVSDPSPMRQKPPRSRKLLRAVLIAGIGGVAHSVIALIDEGLGAVLTRIVVFLISFWLLALVASALLKRRGFHTFDVRTVMEVLAFPQLWYLFGLPGIVVGHCDTFHPLMLFPLLSIVLVHGAMVLALRRATGLNWLAALKIMGLSSIVPLIINVILVGGLISVLGWQPPGDISILC